VTALRVAVATTEAPAEVQALAPEDAPDVKSVICVDGGSEALPVSRVYDGFVRRPTGVIEARFGHRVWRMDVTAPIGDGESWQLGVYAAHMLHANGQLAIDSMTGPWAGYVLATGAVDTRLNVRAVDHVRTKLRAAAPRLHALLRRDIPVYLALPEDNAHDVAPAVLRELGLDRVDVFPCRRADALDTRLPALLAAGESTTAPPKSTRAAQDGEATMGDEETRRSFPRQGKPRTGGRTKLAAAATVVLLLMAGVAWLLRDVPALMAAADGGDYAKLARRLNTDESGLCLGCRLVGTWNSGRRPNAAAMGTTAVELSAKGIRDCTSATFGDGRYARKRLTPGSRLPETDPDSVCALEYQALNKAAAPMPMTIALRAGNTILARKTSRAVQPGGNLRLRIDGRDLAAIQNGLDVVVLAGGLGTGDLAAAARVRPALLRPDGGDPAALGVQRTVIRHPFKAAPDGETRFQ